MAVTLPGDYSVFHLSVDRCRGLASAWPGRAGLNIFVKKVDAGTRVKVNATFRAMKNDQAITCYSNGALEKALFGAIEKNLGGQ